MSKYKFDVSLVTSGLSEGYCSLVTIYIVRTHCVVHFASISSSLEYILANQTGVTQKDFWKNER